MIKNKGSQDRDAQPGLIIYTENNFKQTVNSIDIHETVDFILVPQMYHHCIKGLI